MPLKKAIFHINPVPGATVYSVNCGVKGRVLGKKTDLHVDDLLKNNGTYQCRGTWRIPGEPLIMGVNGDVTPYITIVIRRKTVTRVG